MSLRAMVWAIESPPAAATPTDRHVLTVLANNAHTDGSGACPAIATIAERVGVSERTVQRSLRRLEVAGIIRRGDQSMASRYGATVYDLAVDGQFPSVIPTPVRGDTHVTPKAMRGDMRGDTEGRRGVTPMSPEPKDQPKNPSGAVPETPHQRARDENPPLQSLDKHGPLTPRCERHATATDNPPCRACALIRPQYEWACALRRSEQDRLKATAIRVVRDACVGTPAPPAIAAAKAALRRAGSHRAIDDDRRRRVEFVA